MEAGLGLRPASWALPHLLQVGPHHRPRPVTGHSTGPWGLPGSKAHVSSLKQCPGLLGESRKPQGEASEQMAEKSPKSGPRGSRGQAPAGDVPAAPGLPRRETDWHEMDAVPSWRCLEGSKTGPWCSSCPYVTAPCPKGQGVPALRKLTPGVSKPVGTQTCGRAIAVHTGSPSPLGHGR